MTRQSYQQGYVSKPIRTRWGIIFKIRYRVPRANGKWKQKRETLYGLSGRNAARAVLDQRLRELSAVPAKASELTFRDFVETFWKPYAERKGMKPSTQFGYECALNKHILPVLGDLNLAHIAPLHIEGFVNAKLASAAKLHPKTVLNLLRIVQGIFSLAVDNDLIQKSPVRKKHRPAVPRAEKTAWTPEQVRAILNEIPLSYRPVFTCLALTELRAGELLGLQWKHLLLETGELRVEQSLWNKEVVTPKTKSSRDSIWFDDILKHAVGASSALPPYGPGGLRLFQARWVAAQPRRSSPGCVVPGVRSASHSSFKRRFRFSRLSAHCGKRR